MRSSVRRVADGLFYQSLAKENRFSRKKAAIRLSAWLKHLKVVCLLQRDQDVCLKSTRLH